MSSWEHGTRPGSPLTGEQVGTFLAWLASPAWPSLVVDGRTGPDTQRVHGGLQPLPTFGQPVGDRHRRSRVDLTRLQGIALQATEFRQRFTE